MSHYTNREHINKDIVILNLSPVFSTDITIRRNENDVFNRIFKIDIILYWYYLYVIQGGQNDYIKIR